MFATVQDLYNAAQSELGDQGGIFIDITDVIQWYNEAVVDIYINAELGRDTPSTYALVAGNNEITALATLRVQKIHLFVIDGVPLKQTNLSALYQLLGYKIDFTVRGQPYYYWREQDPTNLSSYKYKFYPSCQVACNAVVSATIVPAPIPPIIASASVALTQIPIRYHKDILRYIVMKGNMKEKDFRAAELHERMYNDGAPARYDTAHEVAEEFSTIQSDMADLYYGDLF